MHTESDSLPTESISNVRLARQTAVVCTVVVLFVTVLLGIASAIDVLLMLFTGLLFAIFLYTLAKWFGQGIGLNATASLAVVVVLLLLAIVAICWFLVPTIAAQIQIFQDKWLESLRTQLSSTEWGKWLVRQLPQSEEAFPQPQIVLSRATGVVTTTIGGVGVLLMVFTLGLMLAAQPRIYREGIISLLPKSMRSRARNVFAEIGTTLEWWLIAKFSAMLIVGLLTWLGLLFLGIELAATMAVLAALLTFIPNFGPIISAVPAVLLALLQGPFVALWVVVLYIVVQLLESFVVTPMIQYRALSLPPVLVIFAQLAASAWIGIWGLALATPLLAMTAVLVRLLYKEDILHEES